MKHWTLWLILAIVVLIPLAIWLGYSAEWTGFKVYQDPISYEVTRQKTLWDWLDLLLVPVMLAVGGLLFNRAERQTEREIAAERIEQDRRIAAERTQETRLQSYLDKMTELMLEKDLRTSEPDTEVRDIARARTLTALRSLDKKRKGILLQFLHESDLIAQKAVINLSGANLREANLRGAALSEANLREANLREANLHEVYLIGAKLCNANLYRVKLLGADLRGTKLLGADLRGTNLFGADLHGADLSGAKLRSAFLFQTDLNEAHLSGADLSRAKLTGANLRGADLTEAIFSEETTLPDGTKWAPDTDMARFTDPEHPDFWRSDDPDSPAYSGEKGAS